MIHLVVGTFEQGLETSPVECHGVHQTLVSTGPERPVNGSCEDADVGLRPDAGSLYDRMLAGCVRSC